MHQLPHLHHCRSQNKAHHTITNNSSPSFSPLPLVLQYLCVLLISVSFLLSFNSSFITSPTFPSSSFKTSLSSRTFLPNSLFFYYLFPKYHLPSRTLIFSPSFLVPTHLAPSSVPLFPTLTHSIITFPTKTEEELLATPHPQQQTLTLSLSLPCTRLPVSFPA